MTSPTENDASTRSGSLERWLRERNCTEVECIIPDFSGVARGKIMPASKFWKEERLRLPEGVFVQTVTGDYPDEDTTDPTEPERFRKAARRALDRLNATPIGSME